MEGSKVGTPHSQQSQGKVMALLLCPASLSGTLEHVTAEPGLMGAGRGAAAGHAWGDGGAAL